MRRRVEANRQVFHPDDARWTRELVVRKMGALVVVVEMECDEVVDHVDML